MARLLRLTKEIELTVSNKIGVLAEISTITAELGVNIEAVGGYIADDNNAKLRIVTFDNVRVIKLLSSKGYVNIQENDIILVELENKPGTLRDLSSRLAQENIDIKYIYGATCPSGCPAQLVLATSDNKKAMAVLKG
jgi:hypothetical protein